MASNPYVNKVQDADGNVLIDITSDTVTAGSMLSGTTAHDKSGAAITGTIPSKSGSDITVSGVTVSVPAGYYASAESKYITAITVPKDQGFSVTTTADTELDTTSDLVITNNAYRRVDITNKGTILITNSSVTKFTSNPLVSNSLTVTANAPDGTLESDKVIISSGAWVTTTVTDEGTYYGRVIVPNICLVISVSATSSTSKTISDSKITSGHYVFNTASTLPTTDLSWSTSSGSLTLSCSGGIPAMTVFLCRQI